MKNYDDEFLDTLDEMEIEMPKLDEDELKRITALQKKKMDFEKRKSKKIKMSWKQTSGIVAACLVIIGSIAFINQQMEYTNPNNDEYAEIGSSEGSNNQQNPTNPEHDEISSDTKISSVDDSSNQDSSKSTEYNNFDKAKKALGYEIMVPDVKPENFERFYIRITDKNVLEVSYMNEGTYIIYSTVKGDSGINSYIEYENVEKIIYKDIEITIKVNEGNKRYEFQKEKYSFSIDVLGEISKEDVFKIIDSINFY